MPRRLLSVDRRSSPPHGLALTRPVSTRTACNAVLLLLGGWYGRRAFYSCRRTLIALPTHDSGHAYVLLVYSLLCDACESSCSLSLSAQRVCWLAWHLPRSLFPHAYTPARVHFIQHVPRGNYEESFLLLGGLTPNTIRVTYVYE